MVNCKRITLALLLIERALEDASNSNESLSAAAEILKEEKLLDKIGRAGYPYITLSNYEQFIKRVARESGCRLVDLYFGCGRIARKGLHVGRRRARSMCHELYDLIKESARL